MLIGAMNHPARDVLKEIEWMAGLKLDFIDLTLEPPMSAAWNIDPHAIRDALQRHKLGIIGHTAYYLPMASPFESLRRASVEELKRCVEAFSIIGAKWMNIHPDGRAPLHDKDYHVGRNVQSLKEVLEFARGKGIGLMVENLPGKWNTVAELSRLLEAIPELGLHLDVGHSNLMVEENTADELISIYGPRLRHVHMHDNKGGHADLHLALGAGNIDYKHYIRSLKKSGYDGTITLEVFSDDEHFLSYSRDVLRKWWDEAK